MRISFGQIIIVLLISTLLFGDVKKIKEKILTIIKKINKSFTNNNRKKGI